MNSSENIPTKHSFKDAFGDPYISESTAGAMTYHGVPSGVIQEPETGPDLNTIVDFLHQGEPQTSVSDQTVPQLVYSSSYPGSQLYHSYGENPKREESTNSISSMTEQADSIPSLSHGLEQYTNLDEIQNLKFCDYPFQIHNMSPSINQGIADGGVYFSKQPAKHRPQYPNSEGSRGYVKSKGSKNEPTQIQFSGMEGRVTNILAEIYEADANRPSDDYTVVELKRKTGGARSGDSLSIYHGSTHDLDYIGIQVKGVEERGNLKKRAKECRIKVTCSIRPNSGEEYQLSAISDKFNCSQDSNTQIAELEPEVSNRQGGTLMLIKGKNFKTDDSVIVVFEQFYEGERVWRIDEQPRATTKNFIVVRIPVYNGPDTNKSVIISVSVEAGSSNVTNTMEFQYINEGAQCPRIKTETGLENLGGATCPYTQGSKDCGYSYKPSALALNTQVIDDNGFLIPGNTE